MMKKFITLFCLAILFAAAQAQPDYPAAPPSPGNITRMEYFVDTDPGLGNGKPVVLTASQNISDFSFNADLTGLSNGFHRIYLRSMDADGKWSHANHVFFDNYIVPVYATALAATDVTEAEYFIDTDPGQGNGTKISFIPGQDLVNQNIAIDITGTPAGVHRLYIRTKDATGRWSLTNNSLFDNTSVPDYPAPPDPAANIAELEYFIDIDPGMGNGNKITVAPGQDIADLNINVNISGLSTGAHVLYIRSKDADGKWSLTNFSLFDNSVAVPYPSAPAPAPPIGEMEYYIDTDPGFGKATPITFTAGTDIFNLSIDIPLNSIAQGSHTLYIRSRQSPWSLSAYAEFLVASTLPVSWLYVQGRLIDDKALIDWATASETNTEKFVIEHSLDGNNYAIAGELSAAGNSNNTNKYHFTHNAVKSGMNYYRIKQVDLDGHYTYSKVISLLYRNDAGETIVAPNPVANTLHIVEPGGKLLQRLEVFDMSGKKVLVQAYASLQQAYSVDVSRLNKGSYLVKLIYQSGTKSHKIIKQ